MIKLIRIHIILYFLFFLQFETVASQDLINDTSAVQKLYSGDIEATTESKNILDEELKKLDILDNSNISLSVFIFNLILTAI